jgi:hypothetical protein
VAAALALAEDEVWEHVDDLRRARLIENEFVDPEIPERERAWRLTRMGREAAGGRSSRRSRRFGAGPRDRRCAGAASPTVRRRPRK